MTQRSGLLSCHFVTIGARLQNYWFRAPKVHFECFPQSGCFRELVACMTKFILLMTREMVSKKAHIFTLEAEIPRTHFNHWKWLVMINIVQLLH